MSVPEITKGNPELTALSVDVPCMFACPARTNIPEYITAITRKDFRESFLINQIYNIFPGTLGRVCTRPCEDVCRHGYQGNGQAVNICGLKRSAADYNRDYTTPYKKKKSTGKKIAIVGGGPSGLAAARDLLLLGHKVTIYEAAKKLGGMLSLAIPEFRLPRKVIKSDLVHILDLGPEIILNTALGKDVFIEDLLSQYHAVLLALGCQKAYTLGVPGEDSQGVYAGLDFIINLIGRKKINIGAKALVIGGGYTAVDCARMLIRCGAQEVSLVYRRTPREISINRDELHHLEAEDIHIQYLTTPTSFIADKNNQLIKVELVRTRLSNNTVSIIEGSQTLHEFDTAVVCIGQGALASSFINMKLAKYFQGERLKVDSQTFMSRKNGLFGTGDYVNRTRSIIDAVADGRKSALAIHKYLGGKCEPSDRVNIYPAVNSIRQRTDDFIERIPERTTLGSKEKAHNVEVNCGLNREQSASESLRCYLCNLHYEINIDRCIFCMMCIDYMPVNCIKTIQSFANFKHGKREYQETDTWDQISMIYIDNDQCIRCGKCLEVCPTRCISVSKYKLQDPLFGDTR